MCGWRCRRLLPSVGCGPGYWRSQERPARVVESIHGFAVLQQPADSAKFFKGPNAPPKVGPESKFATPLSFAPLSRSLSALAGPNPALCNSIPFQFAFQPRWMEFSRICGGRKNIRKIILPSRNVIPEEVFVHRINSVLPGVVRY